MPNASCRVAEVARATHRQERRDRDKPPRAPRARSERPRPKVANRATPTAAAPPKRPHRQATAWPLARRAQCQPWWPRQQQRGCRQSKKAAPADDEVRGGGCLPPTPEHETPLRRLTSAKADAEEREEGPIGSVGEVPERRRTRTVRGTVLPPWQSCMQQPGGRRGHDSRRGERARQPRPARHRPQCHPKHRRQRQGPKPTRQLWAQSHLQSTPHQQQDRYHHPQQHQRQSPLR